MKSSKESLKELVDFLIIQNNLKTKSDLSLDAGYKAQTLTQAISKKTGHQAVIDNLKIIYRDLLKNSIWDSKQNNEVHEIKKIDDKELRELKLFLS